ncbi:RCC1 domain-containing protein 1 [Fukomys damarensis]|uniref:RCC1 domain-containing protein 1 n=1 Tax=Fukomys damarensis TaxID=885580 RepID=A0A091DWF3_FUKDA|nr:RCC1 domain-containing protein 1 [Fukomys damarensis]
MTEELPGAWFGFGFCGFGQEPVSGHGRWVLSPEQLRAGGDICHVSASWSYTALVTRGGHVELSGSAKGSADGCRDAWASEGLLVLLRDRSGRLELGIEHALLLDAAGQVFSWGGGRHGQLGHGTLEAEPEPRLLEALQGLPMAQLAAGGWHSVCVSETGDIYIWGWNESGQLALPTRSLAEDKRTVTGEALNEDGSEVERVAGAPAHFITIQPFPALLDLPLGSEAVGASCGSRHTAVVTRTGELYTWGWGKYGQLGHKDTTSLDQPCRVEYFVEKQLQVKTVTCGPWNTYVYAVENRNS